MSDNSVNDVEFVVDFLNDLLETDADAVKSLVEFRVKCNEDMMSHETVQVLCDSDSDGNPINPRVGMLGILNGLLGIRDSGMGKFAAEFDEDGHLHRFVAITENEE